MPEELSEQLARLGAVAAECDAETQQHLAELLEGITSFIDRRVEAKE